VFRVAAGVQGQGVEICATGKQLTLLSGSIPPTSFNCDESIVGNKD